LLETSKRAVATKNSIANLSQCGDCAGGVRWRTLMAREPCAAVLCGWPHRTGRCHRVCDHCWRM